MSNKSNKLLNAVRIIQKSEEEYFIDWERFAFGYGYGTGEHFTIPALQNFMALMPAEGTYDYKAMETTLTATNFWLLVNILCANDIIEYGSSPRHGWLSSQGKALKDFLAKKSLVDLIRLTGMNYEDDGYIECYPDHCNCNEGKCQNPFWQAKETVR